MNNYDKTMNILYLLLHSLLVDGTS